MRRLFMTAAVGWALSCPTQAYTADLTFEEVWQAITSESKIQRASQLESKAAQMSQSRASRHWWPKLYLNARSFQTNDPGASFFGLLSQREVTNTDFNPSVLNHPDGQLFSQASLGLDLPLYEGGMKVAQTEMMGHIASAKEQEIDSTRTAQYAEVARLYGSLRGLLAQREKLEDLHSSVARLLKTYQIGSKANPVGYSGLLGLKTLENRLQGLLAENRAKENASRNALAEMGLDKKDWTPTQTSLMPYVDKYFPTTKAGESSRTASQRDMADAAQSRAKMEKARYLPRVGAFAEASVFHGDRGTGDAYSAGVYLQWSLLNPADLGVAAEERLNASAAAARAEALSEAERAEARGLTEAIAAVRENLKLMEESEKLLSEQTRVAADLFKNGSISALQLVEALSRRADLITSHATAELDLLKLSADRATKSAFEPPIFPNEVRK